MRSARVGISGFFWYGVESNVGTGQMGDSIQRACVFYTGSYVLKGKVFHFLQSLHEWKFFPTAN